MVEEDLDPVPADPAFAEITAVADSVKIPRKQRRVFKDAPPLQKPVPPSERFPSEMALRISKRNVEKIGTQIAPTYTARTVSYVECQNSGCLGPAIWIYGDPYKAPLVEWESAYKPLGATWPDGVVPWCQCCQARDGRRVTLKGIWKNGYTRRQDDNQVFIGRGIKANPRYVRTLEPDEAEEFWKSKE